jgi:Protein of unknown function (DUF2911)
MRSAMCFLFAGLLAAAVAGQKSNRKTTDNPKSPSASTTVTLSGKTITIEYNAPSARGRKVEGGLIPYGEVWRTGADAATTLTTQADIMIGDLRVPMGVYTLYTLASENGWNLIVNKQTGQWGTEYDQGQDLGRVPMKLSKAGSPEEKLHLTLKEDGASAGTLSLRWGSTEATVPVKLAQ